MAPHEKHHKSEEDGYFEAYSRFAVTLRTWLVAYGIGGPVLVLSQDKLAERFIGSPEAPRIVVLFLVGVGSQVTAAVLYKTVMWYLYRGEGSEGVKDTTRYRLAAWLSDAYLLETAFDLVSIVLFGVTFRLLSLLTG